MFKKMRVFDMRQWTSAFLPPCLSLVKLHLCSLVKSRAQGVSDLVQFLPLSLWFSNLHTPSSS